MAFTSLNQPLNSQMDQLLKQPESSGFGMAKKALNSGEPSYDR